MFGQSVTLMAVGFAGYIASSTVLSMSHALQDTDSAAYFITDDKIITDKTEVSTDAAMSIVNNFNFVCMLALAIGAVIFFANLYRTIKNNAIIR